MMGGVCSTRCKRINAYESIIKLMKMQPGVVLVDSVQYFHKALLSQFREKEELVTIRQFAEV